MACYFAPPLQMQEIGAARARVAEYLGSLRASPRIVASKDATGTYMTPFCDCIVLGPRGRNVDVISHELVHTELNARVGFLRRTFSIPTWFDEGMALHADLRPAYGEEAYQKATRNGQTAPRLRDLDTAKKVHASSYVSYLTARHEFERWYAVKGRDGLLGLMDAVRGGRGFRF